MQHSPGSFVSCIRIDNMPIWHEKEEKEKIMNEEILIPIVVVPTVFLAIYHIIKTISDNNLRRKIIDKGMLDENVQHLFQKEKFGSTFPASLKWGMVLVALGTAMLIGQLAPRSLEEEATIISMFIFSGLALIAFYFLENRTTKSDKDSDLPQA